MVSDDRLLFESLTLFTNIVEAEGERQPGLLSKAWTHGGRTASDITAAYTKVKKHYQGHERPYTTVAKTITAAALLAAGAFVYNRFLSKAAKKCSDYVGDDKSECMKRVRSGASDAEMNELKKSMALCNMSSDPMTCKKRLKDRIAKVSEQIVQLRSEFLLRN